MFQKVEEFNLQVVCVPSDRKPGALEENEKNWLVGALTEEIVEFDEAHEHQDFVGCIDALMDSIYFAMGGMTRLGIRAEVSKEIFEAVHEANMKKERGVKAEREVKLDLDAVNQKGGSLLKRPSFESWRNTMESEWTKKFIWWPCILDVEGLGRSLVFMAHVEVKGKKYRRCK